MAVVIKVCKVCNKPIGQGKIWMTHLAGHVKEGNEWAKKELETIEQLVAFRRRQREQTTGIVSTAGTASVEIKAIKVSKRPKFEPKSRGNRVDQLTKNIASSIGKVWKRVSYRQGEIMMKSWDRSPEAFEKFAVEMVREARRGLRSLRKLRKLNSERTASTECTSAPTECEQV